MQLKKQGSIRNALALATTSMLAVTSQQVTAADEQSAWDIDSSILFYSEQDRVTVVEPVIRARKEIADDEFLNLRLVVDSLTGSSANGAIKQSTPQTFTTPSGNATYTTPANETPLDPTFHDTRGAINVEWEKPLTKTMNGVFGANASKEYDYLSVGASAKLNWDFNQRNTTLTTGLSYNFDTVDPVGGIPLGLSAMPLTTTTPKAKSGNDDTKDVVDIFAGITQVIDRKTLMQFNYSFGKDSGYLTDPYKILSVVDSVTGNLRTTDPYLYEYRPDSRARNSLYWNTIHQFGSDVFRGSYRYYWDDWGIKSHTIDLKYRKDLGKQSYLQPHFRYYSQDEADFYHYKLTDGAIPQFASADYRLGKLTSTTLGLKYGIALDKDSEFSVRGEFMKQQSKGEGDLPDVDAAILQLSYSLRF